MKLLKDRTPAYTNQDIPENKLVTTENKLVNKMLWPFHQRKLRKKGHLGCGIYEWDSVIIQYLQGQENLNG